MKMNKKISWMLVSCLIITAMVLGSCGGAAEEETAMVEEEAPVVVEEKEEVPVVEEKEEVPVVVEEKVPEYGGTVTIISGYDYGASADPRLDGGANLMVCEYSVLRDQTKDVSAAVNLDGFMGGLVESWEILSNTHFVLHVREGVKWQDLPPVEGREMNANDIVYCIHRFLGLGSGFTQASPYAGHFAAIPWESVTATDDYTIEVKLKESYTNAMMPLLTSIAIYPPEIIEQYGDLRDWECLVGTGPFIVDDYIPDSIVSYVKNPYYWGTDERYPGNRLPYVDATDVIVIPDLQTQMAALRSGKSAFMWIEALQSAKNLWKRNPELEYWTYYQDAASLMLDCSTEPLNDVRVRKALQMAVNLNEIADIYFEGTADPTPFGQMGDVTGYNMPYNEWPEEWKEGYRFDPDGAKALLAEAGYPSGFKITIWDMAWDSDLLRLVKDYWENIGLTVDAKVVDGQAFFGNLSQGRLDGASWWYSARYTLDPKGWVASHFYGGTYYGWPKDDPSGDYDRLIEEMLNADTIEEQRQLIKELDAYAIPRHWEIMLPRRPAFIFTQPWFHGFDKEGAANLGTNGSVIGRTWIDQALRQEMMR